MAAPTVSASLNKSAYAPGETMTLTVTYGDPDTKAGKVALQIIDESGSKSPLIEVPYVVDPLTVQITDTGRVWTKVSDSGSVAVYTSTA